MIKDRRKKIPKIGTSLKIRKDILDRIENFAEKENRSIANAVEVLIEMAFAKMARHEKDMEELKARMEAIEKIELHEHGVDSPIRAAAEKKTRKEA